MQLNCQKHLFNLENDIHYLNTAYKAPLLRSAEEAAIKALTRSRNPQQITPAHFFQESKEVRKEFAKIISASPIHIAIIPSTSYGFATLFQNITGKEKGNAIIVSEEFPSGYFGLEKWCKKENQSLTVIKPDPNLDQKGEDWNKRILESIDTETSVVCISAIHWTTGLRFDLEKIGAKCEAVGAKFLVDGAQTIGALPVDVVKCKIHGLVCAAYKCLFGPYSMSLMYVQEDFFDGQPLEEAWMNREGAEDFSSLSDYNDSYLPGARRFNMGQTSNFILTPILLASLRQINAWGVENIQDYCGTLAKPFITKLQKQGIILEEDAYLCHHLFSIKMHPDKMPLIIKKLKEKNLKLSVRGSNLRISINVFNTKLDLDTLENTLISLM